MRIRPTARLSSHLSPGNIEEIFPVLPPLPVPSPYWRGHRRKQKWCATQKSMARILVKSMAKLLLTSLGLRFHSQVSRRITNFHNPTKYEKQVYIAKHPAAQTWPKSFARQMPRGWMPKWHAASFWPALHCIYGSSRSLFLCRCEPVIHFSIPVLSKGYRVQLGLQ